jgi:hypothetical protein
MPKPHIEATGQKYGFVAYGSTDPAIHEARYILRSKYGIETDYMQIKAIPFRKSKTYFAHEKNCCQLIAMANEPASNAGIPEKAMSLIFSLI